MIILLYARPRFGGVLPLGKSDFLDAIDNEKSCVTIVIHIYEKVGVSKLCLLKHILLLAPNH